MSPHRPVGRGRFSEVPRRHCFPINFGGIRFAGRIGAAGGTEMTRGLFLLAVEVVASAQNLPDVLKQGEKVFSGTCATGIARG